MKLNNLIISLIATYAAAISIPETPPVGDLEARQDDTGELCRAPIVYHPPLVIPSLFFSPKKNIKEM